MIFKVTFTYRPVDTGDLITNDVLIMADSRDEAAQAFFASHYTVLGQHKIKSIETFSTVPLDTFL